MSKRNNINDAWEDWSDEEPGGETMGGGASERAGRRHKVRSPALSLLYEDEDVLVVNKPAGLPTGVDGEPGTGAAANGPDSVLDQLARRLDVRDNELAILEHMAEGVSGVLLAARSALARHEMPRQFARREVEKAYLAIVRAAVSEASGEIDAEIGPDKSGPARMRVGGSHARPALTHWTLRDRFAGFSLLECRTRRERIDQVRLHLQAAGMPLAVDPEYGGSSGLLLSSFKPDYRPSCRHEERPLIGRVSLHALAIEFRHPQNGATYRVEAPMAKDFRAALNQLDKHGRIGVPPQ